MQVPVLLLLLAAAAWTAAAVLAPLLFPSWSASLVYAAAETVCHQLPSRSFHLAGEPLAVCARCLGLYAGGVAGLAAGLVTACRPRLSDPTRARLLVVGLALPSLTTVLAEHVGDVAVGNLARCVTAVPLGAGIAWVIAGAMLADLRRPAMSGVD